MTELLRPTHPSTGTNPPIRPKRRRPHPRGVGRQGEASREAEPQSAKSNEWDPGAPPLPSALQGRDPDALHGVGMAHRDRLVRAPRWALGTAYGPPPSGNAAITCRYEATSTAGSQAIAGVTGSVKPRPCAPAAASTRTIAGGGCGGQGGHGARAPSRTARKGPRTRGGDARVRPGCVHVRPSPTVPCGFFAPKPRTLTRP